MSGKMWKKGELVWANFEYTDIWFPGMVEDPSHSSGVLVSFFGLKEPRFFPAPFLLRFELNFRTRIMAPWGLRRQTVSRVLRAYFWSLSYGLWCPCQPAMISPYLDPEISVLLPSRCSDLALGFVRQIARCPISYDVPFEDLVDANLSNALILSFRRYTVDFEQSEALYEELILSAERTGLSEESESCVDPSNDVILVGDTVFPETVGMGTGKGKDLSVKDPSSLDEQLVEDVEAQVQSCNLGKPLAESESSMFLKACKSRETQTSNRAFAKPVERKREASPSAVSADSFKKRKIANQQSASCDNPLYPHALTPSRIADPRCLHMKFLGNRDDLPSEASLVKRFSVFGRIDASETYVEKDKRSAQVTFLRSVDAVTAYMYARSNKISFGQAKFVYRSDLFEQSSERNKDKATQEEASEQVPMPKSCLKKPGSADEARRRSLKVRFQMEDN